MEDSIKKEAGFISRFVAGFVRVENYLAAQSRVLVFVILGWALVNVVARYVFAKPIMGTYAFIALLLIPITFLAWAFVMQTRGMTRITFLLDRVPGRGFYAIRAVTAVISVFAFIVFAVALLVHTIDLWQLGIVAQDALDVPEWPFYGLGTLGAFLLVIRLVIEAVVDVHHLIKPPAEKPVALVGG